MVVPMSVEAQFRRLDKNLAELKRPESEALSEDQSILVAEICNSCILTLDKAMNALWEAKGEVKDGRQKPNIYFPTRTNSREKLTDKLQQYQMPNLEKNEPKIFSIIESVQAYNGVRWLRALHDLAEIRHEKFPKITQENNNLIIFGRGQGVHLDYMIFDDTGNVKFRGHGINEKSGEVEPLKVKFINGVRSVLEGVGEEPYQFCSSSVAKVKMVVRELYKHISRK